MEESDQALKLRRNALSPVSSLPPEVFATIFSFLCLPVTSSLVGKPDHHLARLRVTRVCHQWREIALNQILLWSHVDFTTLNLAGIGEILVGAKSVPLYLEANFSGNARDRRDDFRLSTFQKELQARVPHMAQHPLILKLHLMSLYLLLPLSSIFLSLPLADIGTGE